MLINFTLFTFILNYIRNNTEYLVTCSRGSIAAILCPLITIWLCGRASLVGRAREGGNGWRNVGELETVVAVSNGTLLCGWLPAGDNRFVADSVTDEGTKF